MTRSPHSIVSDADGHLPHETSVRFSAFGLSSLDMYRRSIRVQPLSRPAVVMHLVATSLASDDAKARISPEVQEQRRFPVRLRLSAERWRDVDGLCARHGISRSRCIRHLIRVAMKLVIQQRGGFGVGSLSATTPRSAPTE